MRDQDFIQSGDRAKGKREQIKTFVDFKAAVGTVKNYDEIDIRLNDNQCAVDLDHCIKNSVLLP